MSIFLPKRKTDRHMSCCRFLSGKKSSSGKGHVFCAPLSLLSVQKRIRKDHVLSWLSLDVNGYSHPSYLARKHHYQNTRPDSFMNRLSLFYKIFAFHPRISTIDVCILLFQVCVCDMYLKYCLSQYPCTLRFNVLWRTPTRYSSDLEVLS
jgi:hypothetical protein